MVVLGAQDLVDDVAVVGQEDQAFGVLVEPADREHALGVIDEIDDVALDVALGRAGDADWLVECDVDRLDVLAGAADHISVELDLIAFVDLRAERRGNAVDRDAAFFDEGIGLAP